MVGGGVLSLPYAVARSGFLLGVVAIFLSAFISAWTFEMLVDCSRRTGRDSYMLVAQAALGPVARQVTVIMIVILCWLGTIAYAVLIGDLLEPVAEYYLSPDTPSAKQTPVVSRQVLIVISGILISPMCVSRSLGALKYLCLASVASVCAVTAFIGWSALSTLGEARYIWWTGASGQEESAWIRPEYRLFPANWVDAAYAIPVFGVSFLCHFNALPAHQELTHPTRWRIRRVVTITMCFTTVLYALIGNFGYLFAADQTCGNVLLNFSVRNGGATMARCALGLVLTFNFPLLVLPAREALYQAVQPLRQKLASRTASIATIGTPAQTPTTSQDNLLPTGQRSTSRGISRAASGSSTPPQSPTSSSGPQVHVYVSEMPRAVPSAIDVFQPKDENFASEQPNSMTFFARLVTTLTVFGSALALACTLRSVLVVWSILGSTVALLIACIFPASFWLQITGAAVGPGTRACTLALVVGASIMSVVCTALAITRLDAPACPGLKSAGLEIEVLGVHGNVSMLPPAFFS
eukprot:TRINITY_DN79572_c0_g1_i1.p1 TRINITY_DN79572_c0_g1~~TRINITY_DN79572_c0_g1_i1.p1  ORF type:complete len:595 (+),score=56.78 TRINITY_DN79572_c0_g1_i1:219-1787(+)